MPAPFGGGRKHQKPILPSIRFDVEADGATEHSFAAKRIGRRCFLSFGPSHGK